MRGSTNACRRAGRAAYGARVTAERKTTVKGSYARGLRAGLFGDNVTQRVAVRKHPKERVSTELGSWGVRVAAPAVMRGGYPTPTLSRKAPAGLAPEHVRSARLACCRKSRKGARASRGDAAFDRTSTSRLSNRCTRLLAQACDTSAAQTPSLRGAVPATPADDLLERVATPSTSARCAASRRCFKRKPR